MNNKKAYLVYNQFIDPNSNEPSIGGIQAYICDLADLFYDLGYRVVIVQSGPEYSSYEWNNFTIATIGIRSYKTNAYCKLVAKYINKEVKNDDFVVFMTHTLNCKIKHSKTISIQHGIYWDMPHSSPRSNPLIEFVFKGKGSWNEIKKVNMCKYCVAVDYNFLNWYKTQQYYQRSIINVIPNYSEISNDVVNKNDGDQIKILFARRFEQYRGTRIFADAILKLLSLYPDIHVTFAGSGPDEDYLKEMFSKFDNVKFIRYKHGESGLVHSKHSIAVVASIGSEGTSLSLLEAMAAKCAVVATNVGGLTNIIIDGYNGLISNTTSDSLFESLKKLVEDKALRKKVSENGYLTVKEGFSKNKWQKSWFDFINKISELEK